MAEETVYASADTFITGFQPTTNKNSDGRLIVGDFGGGDQSRALLRFTLPSDPGAGTTIDKIELKLYYYSGNGAAATDINVYADAGGTPDTSWVASQATWNQYSSGNNWTAAGAAADFSSTIVDTLALTAPASNAYETWVLQGAGAVNPLSLAWGDTVNLLVRAPSSAGVNRFFEDTENTGLTKDPKIVITYSAGGGSGAFSQAVVIA